MSDVEVAGRIERDERADIEPTEPVVGDVRAAIIRVLNQSEQPMTHREIKLVVGQEVNLPSISIIDAQLDVLIGHGLVSEVQFGRRFELTAAAIGSLRS